MTSLLLEFVLKDNILNIALLVVAVVAVVGTIIYRKKSGLKWGKGDKGKKPAARPGNAPAARKGAPPSRRPNNGTPPPRRRP